MMVETPIIPIEPATATKAVLLNFDNKLETESPVAVKKDIEDCFFFPLEATSTYAASLSSFITSACCSSLPSYGLESERISPSFILTIRVAYFSASSGL